MKCIKCSELIVIRRTFKNLFESVYQVLCDKCLKELVFSYYYQVIPINQGLLHHYYLTLDDNPVDKIVNQFLLEPIYQKAIKLRLPVIYFDKLDEEKFNMLDNLFWGDLLIITIS